MKTPSLPERPAVVDPRVRWNYDLDAAPKGSKVQLLNRGFVATSGEISSVERAREFGFIAWCELPDRDHEVERLLGLHGDPKLLDQPGFEYK